jgi:hypothetical protein
VEQPGRSSERSIIRSAAPRRLARTAVVDSTLPIRERHYAWDANCHLGGESALIPPRGMVDARSAGGAGRPGCLRDPEARTRSDPPRHSAAPGDALLFLVRGSCLLPDRGRGRAAPRQPPASRRRSPVPLAGPLSTRSLGSASLTPQPCRTYSAAASTFASMTSRKKKPANSWCPRRLRELRRAAA